MSILFSIFAIENKVEEFFDRLTHRHHHWPMENTSHSINQQKLRPTRTRDIKMRKEIIKNGEKFNDKFAALNAFAYYQFHFIQKGFLVCSHVDLLVRTIELTVHFDYRNLPTMLKGINYSRKELTSHTYYSDREKKLIYVRCLTLRFQY